MKNELVAVQNELLESYHDQTSAEHVLSSVTKKIVVAAQTAIDAANETSSYDEKIKTLVTVVQEIVAICAHEKDELAMLRKKYADQAEIIDLLINRTDLADKQEP